LSLDKLLTRPGRWLPEDRRPDLPDRTRVVQAEPSRRDRSHHHERRRDRLQPRVLRRHLVQDLHWARSLARHPHAV